MNVYNTKQRFQSGINFCKAVLLVLLITASKTSHCQEEKMTLAEKIPGWYRFEKGRHGISLFVGLDGFEARDEDRNITAYNYIPSIRLGYNYIPLRSIVINSEIIYAYSFNYPSYDRQNIKYFLGINKTFFGKNKFFMGTGVDFVAENFRYRIHPEVPDHRYFGDIEFHKLNSHYMYYLKPNIYLGYCFGNNTILQTGVGYNIYLGEKRLSPFSGDIKFTYFFPLKNKEK